jgi:hypothetical protein
MIVMPYSNLGTPKVMMSKKRLQEEMDYTLTNCGYPISLNLLPKSMIATRLLFIPENK